MFETLGPLPLTVRTGSGKFHTYVAADETLPAKIWCGGEAAGDVRRLPSEYVVCPPSVHPCGEPYACLVDRIELEPLPAVWRAYLTEVQPAHDRQGEGFEWPDRISKGERHRTFFRWTRSLKASGHSLDDTIQLLKHANECICSEPLEEWHLVREIERAWSKPDRPDFMVEEGLL
jgi:hypothetical protein